MQPGGRIVISDVPPCFVALGAQAFYRGEAGRAGYIRNHVHWPGSYLRAFQAAGVGVRACHELLYRREEIDLWADKTAVSTEVIVEALVGLPAVVIWDLDSVDDATEQVPRRELLMDGPGGRVNLVQMRRRAASPSWPVASDDSCQP